MRAAFFILLLLSLAVTPAASDDAGPDDSGKKSIEWSLDGQVRFRGEFRDNFDLNDDADDDTRFWLSRVRLGFRVTIDEVYGVYVQAQDSRVFGEEASTASNEANIDLHQGYVDLWRNTDRHWSVRLGRQEWIYGDERLLGAFGWDNVGRAFDGVQGRFRTDSVQIDGLLARLGSSTNASGGTVGTDLYGIYARGDGWKGTSWEGYWLGFSDNNEAAGELGMLGDTEIHAFGGRCIHKYGLFDANMEAAWETGEINGDDLEALAAGLNAGFTLGDETKLRLFGGYDFATGDEDPADGEREEFFNFFPTNHKHYGYMDLFGWRNIRSWYFGGKVSWERQWFQAKFHRFSLEDEHGPWKSAGGAVLGFDPSGSLGRNVGQEIDLTYNFAFLKKSGVQVGYGIFEPNRFAEFTRGGDTQHWAYVQLVVGF